MARCWSLTLAKPGHLGDRLDRLLLELLEGGDGQWKGEPPSAFSRSQIQNWIEKGWVLLDGVPISRSSPLKAAFSAIMLNLPEATPLSLVPENRSLDLLFEDEHLLVVNKPPGLTVHPSETQTTGTLVHALLHQVKDLSGIGGVLRPGIVHRIDKDTSGALVVTKTDRAHLALTEIFAKHAIERKYWALTYGSPNWPAEIRYETLIARHPKDRKRMSCDVREGRKAISHFRRIESYGESSKRPFAAWVEAELETGRTHQVRVHLTALQHSILGDPIYGAPTANQPKWKALPRAVQSAVEALPGQALHARVLGFTHPVTGIALRFEAPPPPAFQALLDSLASYR